MFFCFFVFGFVFSVLMILKGVLYCICVTSWEISHLSLLRKFIMNICFF